MREVGGLPTFLHTDLTTFVHAHIIVYRGGELSVIFAVSFVILL